MATTTKIFLVSFLPFARKATFTAFFKDKKSKSHKAVGIKIFLLFLLDNRRIRSRIRTLY